jgi:hypothetical protein
MAMNKMEPIYFAPTAKLGGGWVVYKDSPSPPPAPDYTGAANATAQGNLEAARVAAKANRVNQYTPYGNLTYTNGINGDQDQWRADYSLSPVGQQLLDYNNQSQLGLGKLQNTALEGTQDAFSKPFDYNSVGQVQDSALKAYTDRLDPQWDRKQQQTETQLVNQGLRPGTEAYDNAMRDFNVGRNDAYQQANLAAIQTAPQTFQMATALRSQPLNELNALRTGSQVTNPTFQNQPQQQTTAGPNLLGAAQAQGQYGQGLYNQQQASNNNFMSGLFNLGAAAIPYL